MLRPDGIVCSARRPRTEGRHGPPSSVDRCARRLASRPRNDDHPPVNALGTRTQWQGTTPPPVLTIGTTGRRSFARSVFSRVGQVWAAQGPQRTTPCLGLGDSARKRRIPSPWLLTRSRYPRNVGRRGCLGNAQTRRGLDTSPLHLPPRGDRGRDGSSVSGRHQLCCHAYVPPWKRIKGVPASMEQLRSVRANTSEPAPLLRAPSGSCEFAGRVCARRGRTSGWAMCHGTRLTGLRARSRGIKEDGCTLHPALLLFTASSTSHSLRTTSRR